VSLEQNWTDERWFGDAVTAGDIDENDSDSTDEPKMIGQTLLVSRRKVKVIKGMEDYERIMLKHVDKSRRP